MEAVDGRFDGESGKGAKVGSSLLRVVRPARLSEGVTDCQSRGRNEERCVEKLLLAAEE